MKKQRQAEGSTRRALHDTCPLDHEQGASVPSSSAEALPNYIVRSCDQMRAHIPPDAWYRALDRDALWECVNDVDEDRALSVVSAKEIVPPSSLPMQDTFANASVDVCAPGTA